MIEFKLHLRNDKLRTYDIISIITVIAQLIIFIYLHVSHSKDFMLPVFLIVITAAYFLFPQFILGSRRRRLQMPIILALYGMVWIIWKHPGGAVVPFVFATLAWINTRALEVKVNELEITYPSFPAKHIEWLSISNIVLKDDLLTIDLRNNKIFQQYIDPEQTSVNEQDFNDFCRRQLAMKPKN